ncbi:MAG: flavodoxin family protein [Clostridia bacterium]|jgi:multimeric flavodoxin WrbA|nr:flavodoxin family protein [Clostridia bacterium]MBT7122624.1 flavodoxin family protein [Clostridia bacterium]
MAIVGISGSPINGGNTDRMIQAILDKSGKQNTFVDLSKLKFFPCRGCAHLCATTAMCGQKDELLPYLKKIRDADALVIGSPRHHGNMTAWMISFFSRMWCFLHESNTLKGKPVIFVSVGIRENEVGRETFRASMVKEHEFNVLGDYHYMTFNPPCMKCGKGDTCRHPRGGLWNLLDKDEQAIRNFEITPDKFTAWEDDEEAVREVEKLGSLLREF